MRSLSFLLAAAVLVACGPAPRGESQAASSAPGPAAEPQKAPTGEVVDFLLTSAATDFHTHGPAGPLRFREVRAGHVASAGGEVSYRLCGQFQREQVAGKAEWTSFSTIKTSGYEQYVGAQAASWCEGPEFVRAPGDLSASLQSRLESLR